MEEKKKKKKLTISVSTKRPVSVSNYSYGKQKTSVVIEKKPQRRWSEKKPYTRENNNNKQNLKTNFPSKQPTINRNIEK